MYQSKSIFNFRRFFFNRQSRIGILIIFVGFSIYYIVGSVLYSEQFREYAIVSKDTQIYVLFFSRIFPYSVIITGLGFFLLGYLEGFGLEKTSIIIPSEGQRDDKLDNLMDYVKSFMDKQDRNYDNRKKYMEENVASISKQIQDINKIRLDGEHNSELFGSILQSFSENINENFFQQLSESISNEITKEKRNRIEALFAESRIIKSRLSTEISSLGRRANLNLVIGSLTTIVALVTLGSIVFQTASKFISWGDTFYHYIPRLSLIVFVEIFAYFFLKLYKSNLDDIKYYQNELTNVDLKLSSILTAINFGSASDISICLSELSKTERNFVLKKDETTVEIEKSKLDKEDLKDVFKLVTDILNKK